MTLSAGLFVIVVAGLILWVVIGHIDENRRRIQKLESDIVLLDQHLPR